MIVLRQYSCSSFIIEGKLYTQKEFGIKSGLIKSRRAIKKVVDKVRNKWADNIQKSIDKDFEKAGKAAKKFQESKIVDNPKLEEKLVKEAEKRNGKVFDIGVSYPNDKNSLLKPEHVDEGFRNRIKLYHGKRKLSEIDEAVKKGKTLIFHPRGTGAESLAHEIGHLDNNLKGGKINKVANNSYVQRKVGLGIEDNSKGFKEYFHRLQNGAAIVGEEVSASLKGLNMMRKNGASTKELISAAKKLKHGADTYRFQVRPFRKNTQANTIR